MKSIFYLILKKSPIKYHTVIEYTHFVFTIIFNDNNYVLPVTKRSTDAYLLWNFNILWIVYNRVILIYNRVILIYNRVILIIIISWSSCSCLKPQKIPQRNHELWDSESKGITYEGRAMFKEDKWKKHVDHFIISGLRLHFRQF